MQPRETPPNLRQINKFIVHHSASDFGCAEVIREWHKERGFDDIGYHWVICNGVVNHGKDFNTHYDGLIEGGRPVTMVGAHCLGHNNDSVGICLIGNSVFTDRQIEALQLLWDMMKRTIPNIGFYGHRDLNKNTLCPGIDPDRFWRRLNIGG